VLKTTKLTVVTTLCPVVGKEKHCYHQSLQYYQILTRVSVMMDPDADQVKTSICPGVSKMTYLQHNTTHMNPRANEENGVK